MRYTFGLSANSGISNLKSEISKAAEPVLRRAVEQFAQTGDPARCFDPFLYRAATCKNPRRVIVKAECNRLGANLRCIVTDRPGAGVIPEAVYEDYAERGDPGAPGFSHALRRESSPVSWAGDLRETRG